MASPALPKTILAWQYSAHNRRSHPGIEHNLTLSTIPFPTPPPTHHLIRVAAAALNPADYKRFEDVFGVIGHWTSLNKNVTPGIDFSGTIVVPASGSTLTPGTKVFGAATLSPVSGEGALREYVCVLPQQTFVVPEGVDLGDAAGLTVAGISGYQSVLRGLRGERVEGKKVFINGGSGGTGLFGIQFAKVEGMHVTATCSGANVELVKGVGADEVIDYRAVGKELVGVLKEKGPFDLVVDNAGLDFELYWRAHEYLRPRAPYVMVAGGWIRHMLVMVRAMFTPAWLGGGRQPLKWFTPDPKVEDLNRIAALVGKEKVRVVIDSKFKFDDVPKAFEKLKTGRAKGKIVVEVETRTRL